MKGRFISQAEVARRLGLSRPTVEKMLSRDEIPGIAPYYGVRRVDRKTFEKWLLTKDR